jgi:glutamate---cysteine ligase / carboxylate-amine ligase
MSPPAPPRPGPSGPAPDAPAGLGALPTADDLRAAFDAPAPMTVGLEEELMVLDPATLDLAPVAREVLEAAGGDSRFKLEMPAAQLEVVTPPCPTVAGAAAVLADARRALVAAADGLALFAGAGAHPFSAPEGALNGDERYARLREEYGRVARTQLVFGFHVHVAVRGAERSLAVYNALRGHLPELAALAANAPFYGGRDSGLASVRPKICDLLPRQGVPPAIGGLDELAAAYRWGATAGFVDGPAQWWWELRLHPVQATVEVRVPDTQATAGEAAAVAALVHALTAQLADRHDAGELPPPAPGWRIEENRWSACRHGTRGMMADLESGRPRPTAERLEGVIDAVAPWAARVGCAAELESARALLESNGAERQRAAAGDLGAVGATRWLAARFLG